MIMIPVVLVLLMVTMFQPDLAESATNARRWIRVPLVGFTFQPSTLASVVLMVYVARYLSKIQHKEISFKETLLPLWAPVFLILVLILPANFSTTAMIFTMVVILAFLGGYPLRYLGLIVGSGLIVFTFFILVAKAFPDMMPNRIDTWMSRIDNFSNGEDADANYQIEKAKIAIASGGIKGLGPGKSVQKNFLPQSSSDFIFAIIIEEYGMIGGLFLLLFYMLFTYQISDCFSKIRNCFWKIISSWSRTAHCFSSIN